MQITIDYYVSIISELNLKFESKANNAQDLINLLSNKKITGIIEANGFLYNPIMEMFK